MRWIFILILLISCTDNSEDMLFQSMLPSGETITPPSFPANGVRVFLLTGQSNAYGLAPNTSATVAELAAQPQFKIWYNNAFADLDVGTNNQPANSHSIELGLAKNFNTYYPNEIGYFIQYAISGTAIVEQLPEGSVYEPFWIKVKAGINNLINAGKIPYVYFIYSQGERDANIGTDQTIYYNSYQTLLSTWRANLGGNDIPWATYEIIKDCYPREYLINEVFATLDTEEDFLTALPMKLETDIGDGLHFDYLAHKNASIYAYDFFANKLGLPVTTLL